MDVFHHLAGDDPVEGTVGEREPRGVTVGGLEDCLGAYLVRLPHGGHGRPDPLQFVDAEVTCDDMGAPSECLEGVSAEPAAQVQQAVSGSKPESVVVGGEH